MDGRIHHIGWRRSLGLAGLLVAAAFFVACTDPRAGSAGARGGAPPEVKLDVELGDIFVKPKGPIKVAAGGSEELAVTNTGVLQHNMTLGDKGTKLLNKGEKETIKFGPINDKAQIFCTIPATKRPEWCWTSRS